jgi:hypothetical protein
MVRRLIYGNVLLILMLSAKMGALAEAKLKMYIEGLALVFDT